MSNPKPPGAAAHKVPPQTPAAMAHRFQPGNPGKPKGSRDKLGKSFIDALTDDFDKHGAVAIAQAREKEPLGYMRVLASILPKELEFKRPLADLTDDELANAISLIRAAVADPVENLGIGSKEAAVGKPSAALSTVRKASALPH